MRTISRLYPDPQDGPEEFIEIENTTPRLLNLDQWSLEDASGDTFKLTHQSIPTCVPRSYKKKTHLTLNNNSDIRLIAPDGSIADTISYVQTKREKHLLVIPPLGIGQMHLAE